ncbi:MAG: hypothetical protein ORN51_15125 [Akkermansiaceae bacterium]|nr:hypothetical protein [Akkermansiaceae bacterium]
MTKSRPPHFDVIIANIQFWDTLDRVLNLVQIYDVSLPKGKRGRKPAGSADILRAAVVLLHSGLEEFLRALITASGPNKTENILNQAPLAVDARGGRPAEVSHGNLQKHRGRSVDVLITEAVHQYCETSDFDHLKEMKVKLTTLGVDLSCGDSYYAAIAQLTERRHQIVHRGDVNELQGSGHYSTRSISASTVRTWADAVCGYVSAVGKNYTKTRTNPPQVPAFNGYKSSRLDHASQF